MTTWRTTTLGFAATALLGFGSLAALRSEPSVVGAAGSGAAAPRCTASLGAPWTRLDARIVPATATEAPARTLLVIGLDASTSNAPALARQIAAVQRWLPAIPDHVVVQPLLVTDRSEASATPDPAPTPALAATSVIVDPLPCGSDCRPQGLVARSCIERVTRHLEARREALQARVDGEHATQQARREAQLRRDLAQIAALPPPEGTSLAGFFRKVAELPARRSPGTRTVVVVLSDLAEAGTPDAAPLRRWWRAAAGRGGCPGAVPWAPTDLAGVEVHLLQEIHDGWRDAASGEPWLRLLRCAGATTTLHRFAPQADLGAGIRL